MRQALGALTLAAIALAVPAASVRADSEPIQRAWTPTEKLDKARQAFRTKDFALATSLLEDLLYPDVELVRKDDVVEVHIMLGACHYQLGKESEARREYESALQLDVERGMSELFFSEGAIRLFEQTKSRLREKLADDAKRKEIAERERRLREYIDTIGVYETHSFAQNFIPFGAPQFQNKHRKKGFIVGGGQMASMVVSLGTWVYLVRSYGLSAKVPIQDAASVRLLQQIEVGAGIAFFAFYLYSMIDGMVYYQPTRRVLGDDSIRDLLISPTAKPPTVQPKAPAKPSLRERLHIGPVVMPGGVGIGVGWETD